MTTKTGAIPGINRASFKVSLHFDLQRFLHPHEKRLSNRLIQYDGQPVFNAVTRSRAFRWFRVRTDVNKVEDNEARFNEPLQ